MHCLKKNCRINNDAERMITCWLCHELCHYKCTGLSTLVNESVNECDGLNWFCSNCRKPAVEFYRFFQSTKNRFSEIQKSVTLLSESISNYGNIFQEFSSLDSLKSPNQSSPKRRKSARKGAKDKGDLPLTPCLSDQNTEMIITPEIPDITPSSPSIPEIFIYDDAGGPGCSDNTGPSSSSQAIVSTFRNSSQQNNNKLIEPKQLVVIPPKKSIFVSRFAYETTADEINYYIKNKIKNDNADILTNKFKYSQQRSITSFKITVPPELFNEIVKPDFWPQNTLVREYIFKDYPRNNIARLPQTVNTTSKN